MNYDFNHLNEVEKFKVVEMEKTSCGKKSCSKKMYLSIIIPLLFFLYIIFYFFFILKPNLPSNSKITKFGKDYKISDDFNEISYFKMVQEFINVNTNNTNGTLIYDKKQFKKISNPKISIVTNVHNGDAFIIIAVLSAQNQDLHDIEIIFIEDGSEDNSLQIIKDLMKEDHQIILLENGKNRGILYSVIKGVLSAKGKYILRLYLLNILHLT